MQRLNPLLAAGVIILLVATGCIGTNQQANSTLVPKTYSQEVTSLPTPVLTTTVLTLRPEPFPNSLGLKARFPFGTGTNWAGEVTTYRIWVNATYQWFNPADNQYQTRIAPAGKKYVIVFINMVNLGSDRAPLPPQSNIYVLHENAVISPDPTHALPMKNTDSSPKVIRIGEIEFSKKLYGTEYVEDFGYSHGQKLGFINPGESNAVDGYIIYEVPVSLSPEKAYVRIIMPGTDSAVWKLV